MKNGFLQIDINTTKTVLSSKSLFYKTENFIKQTKYVSNIDILLSKICQAIILNVDKIADIKNQSKNLIDCYAVETADKNFAFLFKFGCQIDESLNKFDIVFFDYIPSKHPDERSVRVDEYVKLKSNLRVLVKEQKKLVKTQDFLKLYLISNISNINLPKLSKTQQQIVETVDKNVLVQGVAGSGKTNICIDKIIFTACKNYSGKVLYTTFKWLQNKQHYFFGWQSQKGAGK